MNANGKIYIIVTDREPSSGGPSPVETSVMTKTASAEGKEVSLFSHWARNKILNTVKSAAQSTAMYSLSNIGNFTGDYITQTQVNETIQLTSKLVHVAMAAASGAKVGGVMGAVIAAGVAVVGETVSSLQAVNSAYVQNRKTNYEIEQLRDRAGLNAAKDGSRGTEN